MNAYPKPIKTIRSHSGHARFLDECDHDDAGDLIVVREIPRRTDIPSPYHSSPEWPVYRWQGRDVIVRETSHRCFLVFDVGTLTPAV